MLLIKYIREHLSFHFLVVFIYGIFFFLLLILTSELLYQNGFSAYSVEDTSYIFEVDCNNATQLNDLDCPVESIDDVSLYVDKGEFTLVSFFTEISSRRLSGNQRLYLDTNEILSSSKTAIMFKLSEDNRIEIDNREYIYRGITNVVFNSDLSKGIKLLCTSETLFNSIDENSSVKIVFLFEHPISDREIKELQDYVYDSFGTYTYTKPVSEVEKFASVYSSNLFYIVSLCILCLGCFIRVIVAVIEEREKEYVIMRLCGASKNKILLFTVNHLLFILNVSVIIGSLIFLLTRELFQGVFLNGKNSLLFFLFSYVIFIILGFALSMIVLLIRRAQYGYKT